MIYACLGWTHRFLLNLVEIRGYLNTQEQLTPCWVLLNFTATPLPPWTTSTPPVTPYFFSSLSPFQRTQPHPLTPPESTGISTWTSTQKFAAAVFAKSPCGHPTSSASNVAVRPPMTSPSTPLRRGESPLSFPPGPMPGSRRRRPGRRLEDGGPPASADPLTGRVARTR